jgi:peptide-methionine (R)-S-oxide reductase
VSTTKTYPVTHSDTEWRQLLTAEQYDVMRGHGTEAPGSCALLVEKRPGHFNCAGCGTTLFQGRRKFESGTGWPSFYQPLDSAIGTTRDISFAMARTAVHCRRCGGHLGHVFDDGPKPTGLRYCMNGLAMKFKAT